MEDITEADYRHTKRFCKHVIIKNVGEYHGFYVQSDTLLVVHAFKKFRNMYLKIYELDCKRFLSAPDWHNK